MKLIMLIQTLNLLETQNNVHNLKSHPTPQQHPPQATQHWVLVNLKQEELKRVLKFTLDWFFKIFNYKVWVRNVTNLLMWTVARKPVSLTIERNKCEALDICDFGR